MDAMASDKTSHEVVFCVNLEQHISAVPCNFSSLSLAKMYMKQIINIFNSCFKHYN